MIINYQKPLRFRYKCECLVDEGLLANAILWFALFTGGGKPIASLKDIFLHGKYPAISIHGQKLHVHRLIYSFTRKRFFYSNEHVHHKNGNKMDARISNLELIDAAQHLSEHNKGRPLTKEHCRKISIARSGQSLKKRVFLPELQSFLKKGWSISKIARHYKCDWQTVKDRIHSSPELLK